MTAPPLSRLTLVELRKMVDTRAGRWLVGVLGLLVVGVIAAIVAFEKDADAVRLEDFFLAAQGIVSVLLPILAILLVTSEWSQRTALTTFTLVPRRGRVIAAKAGAVFLLGLAVTVVALLSAVVGTAIEGGPWELDLVTVGETILYQLISLFVGFCLGLAIQSSAPAIILSFVLPTIISILTETIRALEDVLRWIDFGQASIPLTEGGASGEEWARIATSSAAWILIPLAFGLWRLARSEVK